MAHLTCFLLLLLCVVMVASSATPGCKIRITAKGLELVKQEGLRFVGQELENITLADLHGKEGRFHYNISNVKVTHLQLALSDLHFQPQQHLAFNINNGSISLRFRRQLLYWFFYDIGSINTSAEGVHIHTLLELSKDNSGRLKISNVSCNASISRMQAGFSGTLRKVYRFLGTLITTGVRYLLSQQICPVLNHAGLVLLNSLLDTVPVRNPVDEHIGIDYSLLNNPVVTSDTMDLDFEGKFFPLGDENKTLPNLAPEPLIQETERMVYLAVSEYFFDSALFAYYQAGVLSMEIAGEKVPKDLEILLRATLFGSIVMTNPSVLDAPLMLKLQVSSPPRCSIKATGTSVAVTATLSIFLAPVEQPLIQLTSMTMEARLSAKVELCKKALQVQMDLKRFRIYSNQSALESLALIPLQGPLKTLLQLTIMPIINERTKKGVQIPLPEGIDFMKEVVTNHKGYLTIGADLHFSKGLREVIEQFRMAPGPSPTTVAV
ncbi:phospholipid transfer protein [Rhineura floridana]|uniref:phospholipid transfer protein n=1 Tax=Rhineura floridana TaxID=261503 RepID=UPI002AC84725|nr:phospholipid transfer protein [Rhineura floridana]XP_061486700.1 phospholipid transfer protein [Rhineura floridana]XP_061486702.1 phospholipid transfer protein [Rhineura floridana]